MNNKKGHTANGTTQHEQHQHSARCHKPASLLEIACIHLLDKGLSGTSQLTAFASHQDFNYRSRINELRNRHHLVIRGETFEHRHSGSGVARFKRHWLADRNEARKAIALINHKRTLRGATLLNQKQIDRYLSRFPLPQHAA
ncbi:hypothetical protein ACTG16_12050 [Aeromonas sp. 23P]|uniref:hypothetical protein n=1 Tax=unclassified Aeromonas TaxID=257493 RepID=UPI003F79640E